MITFLYRTVKVAIVGSGLAGLTSAYALSKQSDNGHGVHFDIHMFEKTSNLGMDFSSISIPVTGTDHEWRVDVPMRSFQGGYYPQLIAFYKSLGVAFRRADFSYSFSLIGHASNALGRHITATMIYNGRSGVAGVGMPSKMNDLYTNCKPYGLIIRSTVRAWTLLLFAVFAIQLLICYLWLLFLALPWARARITGMEDMRFREWVVRTTPTGFLARFASFDSAWTDFAQLVLVPLFSAVCTAPEEDVLDHPVEEFLDYIWLTLGTHHYVVTHGVRDVVRRLTSSLPATAIHLSSAVLSIERDQLDPSLASLKCSGRNGTEVHHGFHHIILAAEATSSLPILKTFADSLPRDSPDRHFVDEQVQCLAKFKYVTSIVINHTDDTLLPDNPRDRRDLNLMNADQTMLHFLAQKNTNRATRRVSPSYTMATHILPRPASIPKHIPSIYQTTNPIMEPQEQHILSISRLQRAVITLESKKAVGSLFVQQSNWYSKAGKSRPGKLQGRFRKGAVGIWICGSFAYPGIPLLEGCVVTAKAVVEQGILSEEGIYTERSAVVESRQAWPTGLERSCDVSVNTS